MKTLSIIILLGFVFTIASCSEVNEGNLLPVGQLYTLSLSDTELEFKYEFRSGEDSYEPQTVEVECENLEWEFTEYPDWVTIKPDHGKGAETVSFSVDQYYDFEEDRNASVRLVSSSGPLEFEKVLTINQRHPEMVSILSDTEYLMNYNKGTSELTIETNCKWKLDCEAEWVSLSRKEGEPGVYKVEMEVAENESYESRNADVIYSAGDSGQKITITQEPCAKARINPQSFNFTADGGESEFSIEAYSQWSISDVPDWITLSVSQGSAGKNKVKVISDANTSYETRKDAFVYRDNDTEISISCSQDGADETSLTPKELSFDSTGAEKKTVEFVTKSTWHITCNDEWLHVSKSSGPAGTYTIYVTVDANTSYNGRNGALAYADENETITISVSQAGAASTTISTKELHYDAAGGVQTITIDSSTDWSITDIPSWLHLSKTSSSAGSYEIEFQAVANTSYSSRSKLLRYSDANENISITVSQSGVSPTELTPTSLIYESTGGEKIINFTTNTEWEFQNLPSWISLSAQSGSAGTYEIIVTASVNTLYDKRNATLVYKDMNESINIDITQKSSVKTDISPASFSFAASGGQKYLKIETMNAWEITSVPDWIQLSQSAGIAGNYSNIVVTVLPNTMYLQREATLLYSDKNNSEEIIVIQSGVEETTLSPLILDFSCTKESKELSLFSGTSWRMEEIPSWLKLTAYADDYWGYNPTLTSGEAGSYTIYATAEENLSYESRNVVLKYSDLNANHDIVVNQSGVEKTIISPEALSFEAAAGTKKMTLTTATSWNISEIPAWISVSKANGSAGTYDIDISVNENVDSNERSASLIYKDHNEPSKVIAITQDANPNKIVEVNGTHVKVDMEIAGGLGKVLGENYKATTTGLTISGNVNGSDFNHIKDMIANNSLISLDMSDAFIVAGGTPKTEDDIFPAHLKESRLESVKLPDSVKSLSSGAFYKCNGLKDVDFGDGLQILQGNNNSGSGCFSYCNSLKEIIIPDSVEEIGSYCFYNSGIAEVKIGKSVSKIGSYAFEKCSSIETLDIHEGVQEVGDNAFYECSGLKTVSVGSRIIGNYAFSNCSNLRTLVFYEGVEEIGNNVFSSSQALSGELILPKTLKKIGNSAFYDKDRLSGDLIIPDSVESIGASSFEGCTGFISLKLGENLQTIGQSAFKGCTGMLGDLLIPNSTTLIGENAFYQCTGITCLALGDNLKTIRRDAFAFSGIKGKLLIPNTVTSIGYQAFYSCVGLTELQLGNSIKSIDSYAFRDCYGLSGNLIIPDSVETIGRGAFSGCDFTGLYLGYNLSQVEQSAFYMQGIQYVYFDCKKVPSYPSGSVSGWNTVLKSASQLVISERVEEISDNCFKGCKEYKGEIILPNSLKAIGDYAFEDCTGITAVTMGANVETIGYGAFNGCSGIKGTINLPNTLTRMFGHAFLGCIYNHRTTKTNQKYPSVNL